MHDKPHSMGHTKFSGLNSEEREFFYSERNSCMMSLHCQASMAHSTELIRVVLSQDS